MLNYKKIFNKISRPPPVFDGILASGSMFCAGWLVSEGNFPRAALMFSIGVLGLILMACESRNNAAKNNTMPSP